jgi:transcriptional regulator with XRE-family HTH domain
MKSDKESLSFGQYLQSIRLEKKISLEKISDETRIGLGTLKLIEKEEHENLPAEVFVKGFLRAYARAIGADGGEAVQRYESRLSVIQELSGTDKEFGTSTLRFWWKLLFVLVVYFALFAVSILGMSYLERHSSENEPFKQHTAAQEQQAAPTPAQGDIESDKSVVKAVQEKFVLHITAKEDTWMKVIVDNRDPKEYNLASGDGLELEASSKFNLLIGNAGGVTLRLNDKEIPVVGKNGEMVNLDLP